MLLEELTDKWTEAKNTSDEWSEKNLATEFIEDLEDIKKWLEKH